MTRNPLSKHDSGENSATGWPVDNPGENYLASPVPTFERCGKSKTFRVGTVVADSVRVSVVHDTPPSIPDFTQWPSFPFEGDLRVKPLADPVPVEPPRKGEAHRECTACLAPDEAYIWVGERWRVRAMDRPTGLPMVLILESRSHLDLGDLPNLLAAELGVMTVRLERAIRSLDGVARVHVNRWGDGSAHLHMWFLARPYGRLQLRGTFLSLWDSILPPISEEQWRENLALVAAWLAEFGGRPLAEPPRIQWQAPSSLAAQSAAPETKPVEGGSLLDAIGETAEPPDTPGAGIDSGASNAAASGPTEDPAAGPNGDPAVGRARDVAQPQEEAAVVAASEAAGAVPTRQPSADTDGPPQAEGGPPAQSDPQGEGGPQGEAFANTRGAETAETEREQAETPTAGRATPAGESGPESDRQ
ncbi:hypothetical protein Vse01_28990 [Micromonospora sediminimaris]|uniref:Diadenosine tetraphosphate (Ap4A) hydrolase n=1 Tax=Micromonospora sediminimaris TaxID=547162 RepID=A0A9W5URJ7_9ACTN|nr:hypothetical protein Vse01_28990 [Micromonospora sediminimaris]